MSAVATAPAWALTPAVLSAPGWTVAVRRGRTGAVRVSTTPRHLLVDVADEAGTTWSTQALLDADGWVRVDAPASPPGVLGTDVGLRRLPDLPGSGDAVLAPGDVLLLLSADAIDALTAREGSRAWTDQLVQESRRPRFDPARVLDRLLGRDNPGSGVLVVRTAV
ncbi:hypothetical protein [Angustibacter aerolatus]